MEDAEARLYKRIAVRILPLLFLGYVVAFLDRVNIGFAKLQMAEDLALSDAAYGLGAGIFFLGYCLFEVPSNLILARVGAKRWMARIMVTWGILSTLFMFIGDWRWGAISEALGLSDAEFSFYFLRFLLGIAEAGFFPGVILYLTYWFPRNRQAGAIALFMTAVGVSSVIGSPLSGAILQFCDGYLGWRGWQWLFLIEGLPSIIIGIVFFLLLPDRPAKATWLTTEEKDRISQLIGSTGEELAQVPAGKAWRVFGKGRLWAFSGAYICSTIALYAVSFWMPTLVAQLGIPKGAYLQVGLLSIIPWGTMALIQVVWAKSSDRMNERRWHSFAGYLLASGGFILLALTPGNTALGLTALTMITTGLGCAVVTFWPLVQPYITGISAAAAIAMINSAGAFGGYIGPVLLGFAGAGSQNGGAILLLLACVPLCGGLILMLASRNGRQEQAPHART